jgi:HD superfamily phosphohydrolase
MFNELLVLGDILEKNHLQPTENAYNSFEIGFKKQALSIIQNVTTARNYLYLWIYAHHKVVYSANFLIRELTRLAIQILNKKTIADYFTFNSILSIDDATINETIKNAVISCEKKKRKNKNELYLVTLYSEFSSHKYKRSLFKSLADYDRYFSDFSESDKKNIMIFLKQKLKISGCIFDSYGYFKDKKLLKGLKSLMWVDASLLLKEPNLKNIFINFSTTEILSLDKIPLLNANSIAKTKNYYFYIYYQPKNPEQYKINELKKNLITFLRDSISASLTPLHSKNT